MPSKTPPKFNRYGVLNKPENRSVDYRIGPTERGGDEYSLLQGGTVDRDAKVHVQGVVGRFGFFSLSHSQGLEVVSIQGSEDGALVDFMAVGPLRVSIAGMISPDWELKATVIKEKSNGSQDV